MLNRKAHINNMLFATMAVFLLATTLISSIFSPFPLTAAGSTGGLLILILSAFLLNFDGASPQQAMILCGFISFIYVACTLIAYLSPLFYMTRLLPLLPNEVATQSLTFFEAGFIAGMTDQTGRNAFFIAIAISVAFPTFLTAQSKKKRIFSFFLLLSATLALLLTGKRGHLLFTLISLVTVFLLHRKLKGHSIFLSLFIILILIILVILTMITVFPESANVFLRASLPLETGGDITSGRIELYEHALELFHKRPILGWGRSYYSYIYGISGHNHYLQTLSEGGLIGLFSLSIFCLFSLFQTFYLLWKCGITPRQDILLFSLFNQLFFLLYGLTGSPLYEVDMLTMYLLSISIPLSHNRSREPE